MMCGIFAFYGSRPNPEILKEIAGLASTRGVHGWGIASNNRLEKGVGKLEEAMGVLELFHKEQWLLGHCRLATFGNYKKGVQPLSFPSRWLAHNGNVYNYQPLLKTLQYKPRTDCDSEVLGAMLEKGYSLQQATSTLSSPFAIATIDTNGLHLIRRGLPLFVLEREEGVYCCSRTFRQSEPLREGMVSKFLARSV